MRIENIISPIVFIFSFIVVTFIGTVLSLAILDVWDTSSVKTSDMQPVIDNFNNVYYIFDKVIFLIAIILLAGIAITSYRLATAKVFFLIMIFMSVFLGMLFYVLSYVTSQFMSNAVFNSILVRFPITMMLGTNLHWLALGFIVIGSITLYGKKEEGQYLR